jgi:hypothetical protein
MRTLLTTEDLKLWKGIISTREPTRVLPTILTSTAIQLRTV